MNRYRLLKRFALAALIGISHFTSQSVWAAEMKETWAIEGGHSAIPELVCPRVKKPSPKPHATNITDLSPPQPDEVAGLKPPADYSGVTDPLPLLSRSDGTPMSLAIWGDSHTAAGFFSEQLVEAIGLAQDEVLPSFIPPTVSRPGVRLPIRRACRGGPWQTELAYSGSATGAKFGRALARATNTGTGAYLWLDLRRSPNTPNVKELEILFSPPHPDARATLKITVDDAETRFFRISPLHSRFVIKAKKPFATVKLSVESGEIFLDGFVPTYSESPKLILDTLSIPGATVRAWKMIDPTFLRSWGPKRQYDLAFLQYGTNEGNTSTFNRESYRTMLRESLRGFRAAYPTTPCLLIGPTDRGILVKRMGKKKRKAAQSKDLLFSPESTLRSAKLKPRLERSLAVASGAGSAPWGGSVASIGGNGQSLHWQHTISLTLRN